MSKTVSIARLGVSSPNVRARNFRTQVGLERDTGPCQTTVMKMTFAIPDDLGRRFHAAVPAGERSTVISNILRQKVRPNEASLAAVCRRVNRLKPLAREMAEWERFDDQTP